MALTNLNNTHLVADDVTAANTALSQLETALALINTTLTAEDRQKYGSIHEQNKLFVNKVYAFNQNVPTLSSAQVDWVEFNNDYNSRLTIENLISRLESITTRLKNAKTCMITTIFRLH
jgi:hypothetical protein